MKIDGHITHPMVNGGAPVPLYATHSDAEWEALAAKYATKLFTEKVGRAPVDTDEALAWQRQYIADLFASEAAE